MVAMAPINSRSFRFCRLPRCGPTSAEHRRSTVDVARRIPPANQFWGRLRPPACRRSREAFHAGAPAASRGTRGQSSVTSRCSPQHCAQMRPCTARQKRFSLRTLQMAQLKGSTSVATQKAAKLFHYGIFGQWRLVEPAWALTFRAHPVEKPHEIWRKCFAAGRRLGIRYAQVEQSYCSNLQGGFTNGNRHDQDPARPSHGREA